MSHICIHKKKRLLAELILGLLYKSYKYLPNGHNKQYWELGMQESSTEFNLTNFSHVFIASRHHWHQLPWKM